LGQRCRVSLTDIGHQGRDMVRGIRDHGVGIGITGRGIGIRDLGIEINAKSQELNFVNVFKSIFGD